MTEHHHDFLDGDDCAHPGCDEPKPEGWDAARTRALANMQAGAADTTPAKRRCLYVDASMGTPNGFVPVLVEEDSPGYWPMTGQGEHAQPWCFGKDYASARRQVSAVNTQLGLSDDDVIDIVASSMAAV